MDFSNVCRTCLGSECLNPIFKNDKDHYRYTVALYISTGLKVELNDGLPQNMCKECIKLLNNCLKFRKQCKNVETQLLGIKTESENNEIVANDFDVLHTVSVKRKRSKDDSCESVKVKINEDSSEYDDEIPLQLLVQNVTNDGYEIVDTEMNDCKIDIKNEVFLENRFETEVYIQINNTTIEDTIKHDGLVTDNFNCTKEQLQPKTESKPYDDTEFKDDISDINTIRLKNIAKRNWTRKKATSLNVVPNIENNLYIIQDSNRVTCKLCQKELSKRSIGLHMTKYHPGADTRKTKCDLCDTYVLKEKLNRHKTLMHGQDCFRCGYCKFEFECEEMLVDHVTSCTAKNKKRNPADKDKRRLAMIECDVCHKVMQKGSLRMHKEIKHAGMGPVCEHCGRRFSNKFRLNEHLRAKHGYEKYKCSMCDFRSASSMSIRNHERRHRGEKSFTCETCAAKFHAPYLLAQHRHSHRTEKAMKCDQCPAAFKTNNALKMHKIACHNSHTYQCSMCPRTYSCRHYAVKHLRNVHRYAGPVGELQVSTVHHGADETPAVLSV